jgi:hypothetical protein
VYQKKKTKCNATNRLTPCSRRPPLRAQSLHTTACMITTKYNDKTPISWAGLRNGLQSSRSRVLPAIHAHETKTMIRQTR